MEETSGKRFVTPIWANIIVLAIGIAIGIASIIDGIIYCMAASRNLLNLSLAIPYLLFGIAMSALGIYGLTKYRVDPQKMVMCSYGEALLYAASSVFTSFFLALLMSQATAEDPAQQVAITILVSAFVIIGIVYIAVAVLEGVAMNRVKKGKSPLVVGLVGTIIFTLCQLSSFSGSSGMAGNGPLVILMALLLMVMGVFLIIVTVMTKYEKKPRYEAQYGQASPLIREYVPDKGESLSEEEKVKLLNSYKDLLDKGVITEEEFERKKRELLD